MTLTALFQWWNFIFALPLVLGLLLGLVVVTTGLAGGDGETDNDSDGDVNTESPLFRILNSFGIGEGVPLLVMLPILFVIWGVVGLLFNQLLAVPRFLLVSILISLLATAYAGQGLSKLMKRIFKDTSQAVDSKSLVGTTGSVVYAVTPTGGVVHVRDKSGNIHRVVCRSLEGETIQPNEQILVVDFDDKARVYYVMTYAKALEPIGDSRFKIED
jgi:membrane protein implicated in regulation of membrane protease activity